MLPVAQPHTDENVPSLRIIRPFPALTQWAHDLDLDSLDPTEHGHIPFVIILVKAVEHWKASVSFPSSPCPSGHRLTRMQHDGALPATMPERRAFKEQLAALRKKLDEENFDEAEAQAWRIWSDPPVRPHPSLSATPLTH